ncbi:MAG: TonB-dependent receptor [Ideonella sp.]|nr:TonB-dependent receptor [Ideonella sp.]MBL0148545.1 TonB-dependent receptor [Ideonella sp.]
MQTTRSPQARPTSGPEFRIRPVASACAALLLATGSAQAQQAGAPAPADAQSVVVTGIRRAIETSVTSKRNSDSIIEAISSEDLGKLPDTSIAESLARLPGLTGQRGPDGRVNVISIRGLSPGFSGVLMNGREMVSSNDSRAVEYDQFPSELVGSAVVYKTPDGTLVGQGLSGTVDIRTLRPLDLKGRQVAVNLRGETNSQGNLVPGVASPTGKRFSVSYVDQFADNTIGVALGFARLDSTTQVKLTELVEYGDYTPFGLPLSGNVPSKEPMANGQFGQAMLPMFWTATSTTKRNLRDGLMAVLEYKPNKDLHSQLDLYFSKFDTHEVGGKFLSSMFATWGGGVAPALSNIGTTQVGKNTLVTSATADQMPVTTGNFDTKRKDSIAALGWNNSFKINDQWTTVADLSYSRDVRNETYSEVYAAPFNSAKQQWSYGAFQWNVPVNGGAQTWTPVQKGFLGDPSIVKLGDQQGFDFVNDQDAYTGAVRTPHIKDEIKSLRVSAKRILSGLFSSADIGVNYTQRDKDVSKNETRLLMLKDAKGNYLRDVPVGALGTPFDMSWAGVPSLIRINVPALVAAGSVTQQALFSQQVDNDSSVHEKVTTLYGKLDIDTELAGTPLRGNLGLQVVRTQQSADGWEYRGNNANPDINLLFKRNGGTSYTDVLPSLNLVADLKNNWIARFGLAKVMARPNIVDMRAGTSTPTVVTDAKGTPHAGEWTTAYSGNPELQPWRATSIDLSLEKYFGKRSYVSMAAFRKNLLNYIFNGLSKRDNTGFPAVAPPGVTPLQFGPVMQPLNGQGGYIEGLELAAALEGGLVNPMLDGFGVVASASKLRSSIVEKDNGNVPLNGMSGLSNSVTVYYEKHGISARLSQRYRSAFTATTRDIFLNATTRQQAADKVADMQLGYAIEDGPYKGLSFLLQVNNLFDKSTVNYKSVGPNAPDATALYPNYTYTFGRQTLLGMNYKF